MQLPKQQLQQHSTHHPQCVVAASPKRPCLPAGHLLQILESVIKFRWAALPAEQREGIKNYISNLIIKYSTNEQLYRSESTFINKLNLILVQILKQVGVSWLTHVCVCCTSMCGAQAEQDSLRGAGVACMSCTCVHVHISRVARPAAAVADRQMLLW